MSGRTPFPWIRHDSMEQTRLFFPFDATLVEEFKALIPWPHRRWVAGYDGDGPHWVIVGPRWCATAEAWFIANCGRGKEVARGQMELFG